MIKLVLIDFDDTLCLTEEARFTIENEIAQQMGYPAMSRATHQKHWGKKALILSIQDRIPGIDGQAFMVQLQRALPKYINDGFVDVVAEKNLATLGALKKMGYKIAILTSRSQMEVSHLLDAKHPLTSLIDAFYHKDNTNFMKPDPRVYEVVLKQFNVKPHEVVYVGDSTGDGISAQEAGLHFIAVLESGLKSKKDFNTIKVDSFVHDFTHITKSIQSIH